MNILIAVLASSSIILMVYHQRLSGLFLRLLWGSYHIKYILFEIRRSKEGITYYAKAELYSQLTYLKDAINHKLFKSINKPLFFQNIEYGISTKKLTTILGQPFDYEVINIAHEYVICLKYPVQTNNVMDTYNYYFFEDKYYLGEFSFNKIQLDTNCKIKETINRTYQCNFDDIDSFVIKNANGNHLYYQDFGYKISVNYFNKNNPSLVKLLGVQHQFKRKAKSEYEYNMDVRELSF